MAPGEKGEKQMPVFTKSRIEKTIRDYRRLGLSLWQAYLNTRDEIKVWLIGRAQAEAIHTLDEVYQSLKYTRG